MPTDALHFRRERALREHEAARQAEHDIVAAVERTTAVLAKLRRELADKRQRRDAMRAQVAEIDALRCPGTNDGNADRVTDLLQTGGALK